MFRKRLILFTTFLLFSLFYYLMAPSGSTEPMPRNKKSVKIDKRKGYDFSQRKSVVKGITNKDNPGAFREFHHGIRTRKGETNPAYPHNYKNIELGKARIRAASLNKSAILDWVERGPGNIGGRTRGIAVDPDDASNNTWFAGTVSGGVWKTTNAGQSWEDKTRDLPNLATSTIVIAPSDPNIIYVGTGEGFGNIDQADGSGIWKSTDKGNTWNQIQSTAISSTFKNIMRIIISPEDPNNLVVAAAPGFNGGGSLSAILRTDNGGVTWQSNYTNINPVEQVIANPDNFNTQYASVNHSGIKKSIDGGRNWFDVSNGIDTDDLWRMEIAIAPTDTNRLYLSGESTKSGSVLYITTNGGNDWIIAEDVEENQDWLSGQGWYDNTIAVHPFDENIVFVGGVNLWKITVDDTPTTTKGVVSTEIGGYQYYMTFVDAEGNDFDGGGFLAENFLGTVDVTEDDYTSVELRIGTGKSQYAHRFFKDSNDDYIYRDYVVVPFEVWDVDNDRQLMVAFRDYEDNGIFDLQDRTTSGDIDCEYIFITSLQYQTTPNLQIAQDNMFKYKNIYGLWLEAYEGVGTVDFNDFDDWYYRINWGTRQSFRISTSYLTDSYGVYDGLNNNVHVDHHNITIIPINESSGSFRMINGNDGGVWYSDNGGETFTGTLNSYNTSQFYGVDKSNGYDMYIGGTQDNGCYISDVNPGIYSEWQALPSGDGFEVVWNYNDYNKIMESSQYNSIYLTTNAGRNWSYASEHGLTDVGFGTAPFFTKLADSKQDPELVFTIGISGVWRTEDFGNSWSLIPMTHNDWYTDSFSQIKISLADPQIVWTGSEFDAANPLFVSTDGGLTFNETSSSFNVRLGRITGLETDPIDPNTAFALFSFANSPKILKTTDLGENWTDISGFGNGNESTTGFPDVATYSLLVMPFDRNIIWAGTEIGLFESTNGGANWSYADNGIPAVGIWDMLIVNNEVVVATHGRGVWTVELPELEGYEPPSVTVTPKLLAVSQGTAGATILINIPNKFDSTNVMVNGEKFIQLDPEFVGDSILTYAVNGYLELSAQIIAYKEGRMYKSGIKSETVYQFEEPVYSYISDLELRTDDFIGDGFTITNDIEGFSSAAIHSPHPYEDAKNYIYVLKYPIIVASSDAILKYEDIAIVETGSDGASFGDNNFWDYVVVEGSADGINWIPVADGYDANYNSTWADMYYNGLNGTENMFVTHEIDLQNNFIPGQNILIRFRLLADANINSWGWCIKNIRIQENVTSLENENELPNEFLLHQNYPNPFNPVTTIKFSLPLDNRVKLEVFNILGESVAVIVNETLNAGSYSYIFNASSLSSGVYLYRLECDSFTDVKKFILLK